jgi:hypothetical protein
MPFIDLMLINSKGMDLSLLMRANTLGINVANFI